MGNYNTAHLLLWLTNRPSSSGPDKVMVAVPSTLHYTILLVFKRLFSFLDIFVVVSAVVHAAPIVWAAVWD